MEIVTKQDFCQKHLSFSTLDRIALVIASGSILGEVDSFTPMSIYRSISDVEAIFTIIDTFWSHLPITEPKQLGFRLFLKFILDQQQFLMVRHP
jgi:hypothetical protein